MVVATMICSFDASDSWIFNTREEAVEWINKRYEQTIAGEEWREDITLEYAFDHEGEYAYIRWPNGDKMEWEITFDDPNLSVVHNYSSYNKVMSWFN